MGLTPFRIDLTDLAHPLVDVAGVDLTKLASISRVSVDMRVADVPKVYVEVLSSGVVEGEGLIHITQPAAEPPDQREAVVEFLSNVDPEQLEREMLDEFGGLSDATTGTAVLEVLKRWAGAGS